MCMYGCMFVRIYNKGLNVSLNWFFYLLICSLISFIYYLFIYKNINWVCWYFYRVNKSQSLFYNVPQCIGACQDTEAQLNMDRCSCGLNGGALNVTCNLQIMQFKGISSNGFNDETTDFNNANRKKRDLIYSDDVIYLYDNEKSDQTVYHKRTKRNVPVGMSPENATEYCRKRILDITATKVCLELTGINASSAIQSCAADLQVSDFSYQT